MAGFVLPILSGLAGLFGGGQQQKTTQNTSSNTNQSQSTNQSAFTNPNFSPLQQSLIQLFTQGAADQYAQSTNLNPYAQQGLQTINSQGNANRQTINNVLAQRGLSYSPAAATALTQNTVNTGNQQNSFLEQIPLLQRQLQQSSLQQLMQAFGVIPTGTESGGTSNSTGTSSTTGTGTSTTSGNPTAGALSGFGAALPLAFPSLFGGGNSGGGFKFTTDGDLTKH